MIEILQAIALAASIHFAVAMMCLPQYAASVAEPTSTGKKIIMLAWWVGTSTMIYMASGHAMDALPVGLADAGRNIIAAAWTFAAFPFLVMRCAEAQQQRNTLK